MNYSRVGEQMKSDFREIAGLMSVPINRFQRRVIMPLMPHGMSGLKEKTNGEELHE